MNPQDRAKVQEAFKKTKIEIYPDWNTAKIMTDDGKVMTPAPKKGYPQKPAGLPSQGPYKPADIIDTRDANNRLDLYRYKRRRDARRSTRTVEVRILIQKNPYGIKCPK